MRYRSPMEVFVISCGIVLAWVVLFVLLNRDARDQVMRDFFGRR